MRFYFLRGGESMRYGSWVLSQRSTRQQKAAKNRKYALWFFEIITKETQTTKSRKEAQTIFDNIFNYYKTTFRLWNTSLF